MNTCKILGCTSPVKARGWCNRHWYSWYKRGDPLAARPYAAAYAYLTNVVLAHQNDNCLLWPFSGNLSGCGKLKNTTVTRLVCTAIYGPPFSKAEAAHRCHVPACVNPRHLYWATRQQNEDDKLQIWAKRGRYSKKLDELQD